MRSIYSYLCFNEMPTSGQKRRFPSANGFSLASDFVVICCTGSMQLFPFNLVGTQTDTQQAAHTGWLVVEVTWILPNTLATDNCNWTHAYWFLKLSFSLSWSCFMISLWSTLLLSHFLYTKKRLYPFGWSRAYIEVSSSTETASADKL